jgi:hypothetical protein
MPCAMFGRETYRVPEIRTDFSVGITQTAIFRKPCVEKSHGFLILIVTKFTYGFVLAVMCFNFATLRLCQSFSFSWSITYAKATLIVCVLKVASSYSDHCVRSHLPS